MAGKLPEIKEELKQLPPTVAELCDGVATSEDGSEYISKHPPVSFSIARGSGYGGHVLAFAIGCAYRSIPDLEHEIYSCLGHFLSAPLKDRLLHARVERVRTSRGFVTCRVLVSQDDDSNTLNNDAGTTTTTTSPPACDADSPHPTINSTTQTKQTAILSLTADFHRPEPRSLSPFSATPKLPYALPETLPPLREHYQHVADRNGLPPAVAAITYDVLSSMWRYIETRDCPEGVGGQNLLGVARHVPTSQDGWEVADKVTASWVRSKPRLRGYDKAGGTREAGVAGEKGMAGPAGVEREHVMAAAYALDVSCAFTALMHDGMFMDDMAVCASLDFALRFFKPPDLNEWMLREQQAHVRGANGRSFAEYRLFDRRGELVASMSQQSLLRPRKGEGTVVKGAKM